MVPNGKQRIQFEMPSATIERIEALKIKTEAASYAEVFRNALKLYEALIAEHESGSTFIKKNKDGSVVEYAMFLT